MQSPSRVDRVQNVRASRLRGPSNRRATLFGMIKANLAIGVMNDDDLLACTRELVRNSCEMEAELLLHLAEIDERKLYAQRAYPSMHVFCVKELGFSDGAAYNRLGVARAGRRWPAVLDALRSSAVHLSGLRVLVPHFTDDNVQCLLAEAAGRSKREIEDMAARLSPKAVRIGSGGFRSVRPRACSNPLLERNRVPTRPHHQVRRCLPLANRSIARSCHPLRRTFS